MPVCNSLSQPTLVPEPRFAELAADGATLDDLTDDELDKYLRLSYDNYKAGVYSVNKEVVMGIVDWLMVHLRGRGSPLPLESPIEDTDDDRPL